MINRFRFVSCRIFFWYLSYALAFIAARDSTKGSQWWYSTENREQARTPSAFAR